MAYTPETISETEFVLCPEPDLATYADVYCDKFEEFWPPTTVETAVTRGKRLRECKPSVQLHHEYRVGIDYVKPYAGKKHSRRNCCHTPCYDISNSPCIPTHSPPCGCCPNASSVRCKTYKKSQTSLSHPKQCPMRIIELAAPTKRHCLDTWRSKSHILPDYMLDRIRQHVMDERPVVQIPDALNCFKKRVSNRSSRNSKSKVSDACMSDMRDYSAIFAHCVSRKLDKPLNITLNPELEKISRIVSYEISRVTGKNSKKKKNKLEKKIQDEMSKKVTAWIDNVLEDSSGKLLLDDFRELEEEEGPVWDIIDDLIDNVVTSSEPEEEDTKYDTAGDTTEDHIAPDQTSKDIENPSDDEGKDNDLRDSNKETDSIISKHDELKTDNLDSQHDDSKTKATENANDVTMADILNENILTDNGGQVMDKITDAMTDDIDTGLANVNNVTKTDILNENINIATEKVDEEIDNTNVGLENINLPINKASEYVFEHVTDKASQDQQGKIDRKLENIDDGNNDDSEYDDETGGVTNVSALYMNSEGSLDDMNKTVKFSNVDDDLGIIDDLILENQKLPVIENKGKHRPKTSHESSIIFSSPNESLLSDADESWPNDISVGGPKLSANVSKSVMSLGLINENVDEEKQANDEISLEKTAVHADKPGGDTVIDYAIDVLQNKSNDVQSKPLNHAEETKIQKFKIPESFESQKSPMDPKEYFKTVVLAQPRLQVNIKKKYIHEVESPTSITEEMKHFKNEIIQSVHIFDDISDNEKEKDLNELGTPTFIAEKIKHLNKISIQSVETFDYKLYTEKDKNVNEIGVPTLITEKLKQIIRTVQKSDDVLDNVVLANKKRTYKVDTKTAPLWIMCLCDKGRGEPENSVSKHEHKKTNEKIEGDVRILAKNLEIISANLLTWNDWIATTCRNIKRIKSKSERNTRKSCRKKCYRPKDIDEWIKLEKYITKDAHFWLKLKHSAKKKLKTYKYINRSKQYHAPVKSMNCNCKIDVKKFHDKT